MGKEVLVIGFETSLKKKQLPSIGAAFFID